MRWELTGRFCFRAICCSWACIPSHGSRVQLAFAYNRFLMERIIPAESRLKTLLYLPFCEPRECERMILEFGDHPDVVGFMVTSVRYKSVHHDSYMRTYAMLEEVGKPLCFHAGNNWQDDYLKQLDLFISMHAISFTLCNMVHMTNWVLHGLCERFPEAQGHMDRKWCGMGPVSDAAARQRISVAVFGGPQPEALAEASTCGRCTIHPSQWSATDMGLLEASFRALNAETQMLYASDWPPLGL